MRRPNWLSDGGLTIDADIICMPKVQIDGILQTMAPLDLMRLCTLSHKIIFQQKLPLATATQFYAAIFCAMWPLHYHISPWNRIKSIIDWIKLITTKNRYRIFPLESAYSDLFKRTKITSCSKISKK